MNQPCIKKALVSLSVFAMVCAPTAWAVGGDSCAVATAIVIPTCDGTPVADPAIGIPTATDSGATPGSCFSPFGAMDGDRWFSWTNGTAVAQDLLVNTDIVANPGTGDSEVAIFDDCVPTTELGCDQDGGVLGSGFLSTALASIPPGGTAMIAIDGWNGNIGFDAVEFSCTPTPPPPPGEVCSACVMVGSLPFSDTFDNDTSASSAPPGTCNFGAATEMQNDIWYCITPGVDCTIDVTVDPDAGSGYDGISVVHSGASCAGLTEVECIDDPEPQVFTSISATAGTTYFVQIGDFGTTEGGGTTDITITSPDGCSIPVELQSFSID